MNETVVDFFASLSSEVGDITRECHLCAFVTYIRAGLERVRALWMSAFDSDFRTCCICYETVSLLTHLPFYLNDVYVFFANDSIVDALLSVAAIYQVFVRIM